ncbi:MAG: RNA polymerase sigma factor [bacterium]
MTALFEKKLIEKAAKGDVKSFEKLIKSMENKIFAFALSISGGNRVAAEEIYQEALIKAFVNIGSFSFKSSFSTWLWKIIRNAYFDYLNIEKKHGNISIDDINGLELCFDEKQDVKLITDDKTVALRKLVSLLPLPYSEVITLIDLQEMDHDEAAALLEIDKNLLKVRLHRARTKLKNLIENNMEYFK